MRSASRRIWAVGAVVTALAAASAFAQERAPAKPNVVILATGGTIAGAQPTRQLVADGVMELNLISQDTTYYGLDFRPKRGGSIAAPSRFAAAARALPVGSTTLSTLLRELNALPGAFWIRLLYTHPAHWTDELIQTIADCPKVARYVDMPLQHIHPLLLERMRRETSAANDLPRSVLVAGGVALVAVLVLLMFITSRML